MTQKNCPSYTFQDNTDANFCVAKFFVFHAQDIDKWVYGVVRSVSATEVTGLVPIDQYEGIQAFAVSVPRSNNDQVGVVPSQKEATYAKVAEPYGINARFTRRGEYKLDFNGLQDLETTTQLMTTTLEPEPSDNDSFQSFAMDGRESVPENLAFLQSNEFSTTTPAQVALQTLCIACSDSVRLEEQPVASSDVPSSCWAGSGSKMPITSFCRSDTGFCKTETWQYATKHDNRITSYWVGINRGCYSNEEVSTNVEGEGIESNGFIGIDNLTKFVRLYPSSNTKQKVTMKN